MPWRQLSAHEQQVLSQLAVFRGGFGRQAAEQVAGASLPVLSTVLNRTLVRRAAAGRYGLHVLIRQYCATHLAAEPEAQAAAQKRHYDYFLALAEAADQGLRGRDQLQWLRRLEQEQDNLRAALEWALAYDRTTHGGDELALRLAGALRVFGGYGVISKKGAVGWRNVWSNVQRGTRQPEPRPWLPKPRCYTPQEKSLPRNNRQRKARQFSGNWAMSETWRECLCSSGPPSSGRERSAWPRLGSWRHECWAA